ncbi:MAG: CSLREA domain-containing protein [candidate division Zixibacteria bacterium]|nr:CSLREA domain-containing protein [candidate division Zixibacteria bacterium]
MKINRILISFWIITTFIFLLGLGSRVESADDLHFAVKLLGSRLLPYDINNSSQVVGRAWLNLESNRDCWDEGNGTPFLWEYGVDEFPICNEDIITNGFMYDAAVAINNSGVMVGVAEDEYGFEFKDYVKRPDASFLWDGSSIVFHGQHSRGYGAQKTVFWDINDAGFIAGSDYVFQIKIDTVWSSDSDFDVLVDTAWIVEAVLYDNTGQIIDSIGQFRQGTCSINGGGSYGYGINNLNHIVGFGAKCGQHAFFWDGTSITNIDPTAGSGNSEYSFAFSLNDNDVVVGVYQSTRDIYTGQAFKWQSGTLTELEKFPDGVNSVAFDINSLGQIVGSSSRAGSDRHRPTLWLPEPAYGLPAGIHDLSEHRGPYGRWIMGEAYAINDQGQIAAIVYLDSQYQGVIISLNELYIPEIVVNSTEDGEDINPGDGLCETAFSDECTLRAAIMEANADPGVDTIKFALTQSNIIQPQSPLPEITDTVLIDGVFQGHFGYSPPILDGFFINEAIPEDSLYGYDDGLIVSSGNTIIRELKIINFGGNGISIVGPEGGNVINGCTIGENGSGNVGSGVYVINSSDNQIGKRIRVWGTSGYAEWNTIGYNGKAGIFIDEDPGETSIGNCFSGNEIMGNGDLGIDIVPEGVTPNDPYDLTVNYPIIDSLTFDGSTLAIYGTLNDSPEQTYMIDIYSNDECDESYFGEGQYWGDSVTITTDISGVGKFEFIYEDDDDKSGGEFDGAYLSATATWNNNTSEFSQCWPPSGIIVNSIGDGEDINPGDGICETDSAGECTLRAAIMETNLLDGLDLITFSFSEDVIINAITELPPITDSVVIDGSMQSGGIILSGSILEEPYADGLIIQGGNSSIIDIAIREFGGNGISIIGPKGGNLIDYCFIGGIGSGDENLGNDGHGIFVTNSPDNIIGESENSMGNVIANNGEAGIFIEGESSINTSILANNIYRNGGLGIDYDPEGVNKIDDGPYGLLPNYPTIDSVLIIEETETIIYGTINDRGSETYRVDIFISRQCDPSTYGEGQYFEDSAIVITDPSGIGTFLVTLDPDATQIFNHKASYFTATSTLDEYTSEFSVCWPEYLIVNSTEDDIDIDPGDGICNTGDTTNTGAFECTLRAAIQESNKLDGMDTILFYLPDDWTIMPDDALPSIIDSVFINGASQEDYPILDGSNIDFLDIHSALRLEDGSSIIRGLTIQNFPDDGIKITGPSFGNIIEGCTIGDSEDDEFDTGNKGGGISISYSSENKIGGFEEGLGEFLYNEYNEIENNKRAGISIYSDGVDLSINNNLRGNVISSNGELGIDYFPPIGVTPNDTSIAGAFDTLTNYPIIDSVILSYGNPTNIYCSLIEEAEQDFVIDLYINEFCDGSGHGEGYLWADSLWVTTDTDEKVEFQFQLESGFGPIEHFFAYFTLTATFDNNTSEFSPCWPSIKKIRIVDDNGMPIPEQEFLLSYAIYDLPEHPAESIKFVVTDIDGIVDLDKMWNSDTLMVGDSISLEIVLQEGSGYYNGVNKPWVVLDNGKFDETLNGLYFDTLTSDTLQDIVLDHSTFVFDLVIGIEWDATRAYIDSVKSGIAKMANYLYDVSDGQIAIGLVTVAEDLGRKTLYDDFGKVYQYDILIVAQNDMQGWICYDKNTSAKLMMPRRYFHTNQIDQSAHENPMNPAAPEHYRRLAQLLGTHLLDFRPEVALGLSQTTCDRKGSLGFMASIDMNYAASSEMSWSINYENYDCRKTGQWRKHKMSCWDYFEVKFEKEYADVFVPIKKPDEQILLPDASYFYGPNNTFSNSEVNLQYDAGKRVDFYGENEVSDAYDELWYIADDQDNPLPNINLIVYQKKNSFETQLNQGYTNDEGLIWVVGLNSQDAVEACGVFYEEPASPAKKQSVSAMKWYYGMAEAGTGDPNIILKEVEGDFPLICSADLTETHIIYSLNFDQQFTELPYLTYNTDDGSLATVSFTQGISDYEAVITLGESPPGNVKIYAADELMNTFFFNISYSLTTFDDPLIVETAVSLDGFASIDIDSLNNINQISIVSSPYPILRNGLPEQSIQAGPTYSVSWAGSGILSGENMLAISYDETIFGDNDGLFDYPQSLLLFQWNNSNQEWVIMTGVVDTSLNIVSASITEPGTYAAFATDITTDIVDNENNNIIPDKFGLSQNYPNPFNPTTIIEFDLPAKSHISIEIFNILGQKLQTLLNTEKPAGIYSITWDGTDETGQNVSSGIYLYRIKTNTDVETKKMILLK